MEKVDTEVIVWMYTDQHLTLREIGPLVGMSATGVGKRLKAAGVQRESGTWVNVKCSLCSAPFKAQRKRWKIQRNHFCSEAHRREWMGNSNYRPWRQGQRIAREKIRLLFKLQRGNVIHHKDDDNHNNELSNLAVFASQSDHLKHHHGDPTIKPLWDGANPRTQITSVTKE